MIDYTYIFVLLVLFQLKHFVCDYPLQNQYMLGKFKDSGWAMPLSAHAGTHALFTFGISIAVVSFHMAFLLMAIDLVIHFTMDRIKASKNMLGRFKQDNPKFWWSLGFDQMIHHLTHYGIVLLIVMQ